MNYKEALQCALSGEAILFTGAGFSAGTHSIDGFSPPQGTELAHILCAQTCMQLVDDLKDAADVAIRRLTAERTVCMLNDMFRIQDVTEYHESLSRVP